jgi:hypothetical protein
MLLLREKENKQVYSFKVGLRWKDTKKIKDKTILTRYEGTK